MWEPWGSWILILGRLVDIRTREIRHARTCATSVSLSAEHRRFLGENIDCTSTHIERTAARHTTKLALAPRQGARKRVLTVSQTRRAPDTADTTTRRHSHQSLIRIVLPVHTVDRTVSRLHVQCSISTPCVHLRAAHLLPARIALSVAAPSPTASLSSAAPAAFHIHIISSPPGLVGDRLHKVIPVGHQLAQQHLRSHTPVPVATSVACACEASARLGSGSMGGQRVRAPLGGEATHLLDRSVSGKSGIAGCLQC